MSSKSASKIIALSSNMLCLGPKPKSSVTRLWRRLRGVFQTCRGEICEHAKRASAPSRPFTRKPLDQRDYIILIVAESTVSKGL